MDVYVFRFVKIALNSKLCGVGSYIAYRDTGGLFHYIAQCSRKLQLSRAVHNGSLDLQYISSHGGICKTVDNADFVFKAFFVVKELARSKQCG